jgi:hypothetical protein
MWGEGIYFAQTPDYCCNENYCHRFLEEKKEKQKIFLANIILGESFITSDQDESLRLPPLKKNNNSTKSFTIERYDSVSATHPTGHTIYILYSNARAYPSYLITFDDLNNNN